MTTRDEPRHGDHPAEADFEVTDGGWDPYITALMMGARDKAPAADDPEDDGVPVMSFSGKPPRTRR